MRKEFVNQEIAEDEEYTIPDAPRTTRQLREDRETEEAAEQAPKPLKRLPSLPAPAPKQAEPKEPMFLPMAMSEADMFNLIYKSQMELRELLLRLLDKD